ncbi:NADH dehydrogenase [candidate division SR1 bacterium]|nr:NADH dehydrogenase [candidate division SR1 bacterium]
MNTLECIKTRRSIRDYIDKKIEKSDLAEIVESGMYAPSAHNQQPREFYIITDKEKLNALSENLEFGKMLTTSGGVVLVCFDKNKYTDMDFIQSDLGACTQNMLLTAHEKGIGSVWIGVYPLNNRDHKINEILNIPQQTEIFSIISLGYQSPSLSLRDKKCVFPEKIHWIE